MRNLIGMMKLWACFAVVPIMVLFYLTFLTPGKALTENVLDVALSFKAEDNYLIYQNDTFSFKIDYPSNWMVVENNADLLLRVKDGVVNFFAPPEDNSDFTGENLNIVVSKLDESDSTSLDGLPEKLTPYYKEIFGVREPLESQDVILDGNPAKKITFSYEAFGRMLENTQVFSIKSDYVYVINYICEPLKCSSYLPTFEKMIHSFKFINP